MKILLVLTFVFGPLKLLLHTPLFQIQLGYFFNSLFGVDNINPRRATVFKGVLTLIDIWFFHFSLCYQSWYWIFK